MRSARPIEKPTWAFGAVPVQPHVGTRARAAQLRCHITDAIPGQDALDEQQATAWCQTRIRVRHEDLRGVDGLRHVHNSPAVLTRSRAVTNPVGSYTSTRKHRRRAASRAPRRSPERRRRAHPCHRHAAEGGIVIVAATLAS